MLVHLVYLLWLVGLTVAQDVTVLMNETRLSYAKGAGGPPTGFGGYVTEVNWEPEQCGSYIDLYSHSDYVELQFNGTSVTVNVITDPMGTLVIQMILDSSTVTRDNATGPNSVNACDTRQITMPNLSEGLHSLVVSNYGNRTLYIHSLQYTPWGTQPSESITPSHSSNKAGIIGGVVGGVVALIILGAVAFFWRSRQRRASPRALQEDLGPMPSQTVGSPVALISPLVLPIPSPEKETAPDLLQNIASLPGNERSSPTALAGDLRTGRQSFTPPAVLPHTSPLSTIQQLIARNVPPEEIAAVAQMLANSRRPPSQYGVNRNDGSETFSLPEYRSVEDFPVDNNRPQDSRNAP